MANARDATRANPAMFPWRWMGRAVAAALLIGAAVALATQVEVRATGTPSLACGSGWDVVAGRAGWSLWWSADLTDPAQQGRPPVRTVRCPTAVNRRAFLAGAFAATAVAVVAAGELAERRRQPARSGLPRTTRQLRLFGTSMTVVGSLLTIAGLTGLALLVADPHSTLFLYVTRPAVVLAGLLLVVPAILLIALGRAAVLLADDRASNEASHASP